MHAALAPGESLAPGARVAAATLLADARVAAVLVPIVPTGDEPIPSAARRYMAAWDARFLHRQTFFAPGARVLTREPLPGWRAAEAAPFLARAIDEGRLVEVLPASAHVDSPIARDMDAWIAWAREEGAAWGRLAWRDARFAPFSPARTAGGWWAHNVWRATRRAGEVTQAMRRFDALAWMLHAIREATWTGACVRGAKGRS